MKSAKLQIASERKQKLFHMESFKIILDQSVEKYFRRNTKDRVKTEGLIITCHISLL